MLRLSANVRSTHQRDGAILLDVLQGQMFQVNPVGSRIIEILTLGTTELAIVDAISREFGIVPGIVTKDVRNFIEALETHRLVERCDTSLIE
jgi:hypothetical protein